MSSPSDSPEIAVASFVGAVRMGAHDRTRPIKVQEIPVLFSAEARPSDQVTGDNPARIRVDMNVLPLAPCALVEQLIIGLSALVDVSVRVCKPSSQWITNLRNPDPLFNLLRLHVPKSDLLLLSALLLAGAPPEDAFEGNL